MPGTKKCQTSAGFDSPLSVFLNKFSSAHGAPAIETPSPCAARTETPAFRSQDVAALRVLCSRGHTWSTWSVCLSFRVSSLPSVSVTFPFMLSTLRAGVLFSTARRLTHCPSPQVGTGGPTQAASTVCIGLPREDGTQAFVPSLTKSLKGPRPSLT